MALLFQNPAKWEHLDFSDLDPEKLDQIRAEIKSGILIYPFAWADFFDFLMCKLPSGTQLKWPLILGGSIATDSEKNERLLEQIAVAEKYGLLNEALSFLALLPEDEWQKSAKKAE